MSDDVVIRAENLGKKYIIRHDDDRSRNTHVVSYTALRDVLANRARGAFASAKQFLHGGRPVGSKTKEEFWALKNVDFEVRRGEVLGIIGRNGAGKSTLLKVLSRITEPSEGRVTVKGRVASLLEVGTGFHPELTGRENVYLNGTVLGMARAEVRRKFDEIVDFAEVEKFLDTPVKRYSSGMYMRLAFAIAAHLEPEILVVDEVLAVGDAEFQKKCLGKIQAVSSGQGRTVLFVSHNMGAVADICPRAILLEHGHIAAAGPFPEVVGRYTAARTGRERAINGSRSGKETMLLDAGIVGEQVNGNSVFWSEKFSLHFHYRTADIPGLEIGFAVVDKHGRSVFVSSVPHKREGTSRQFIATVTIPARFLAPGDYSVTAGLHQPNVHMHDYISNLINFAVIGDSPEHYRFGTADIGVVTPQLTWQLERLESWSA